MNSIDAFNEKFLKSGYTSIDKFIEDTKEIAEGDVMPMTVSTQFQAPNRPEIPMKKKDVDTDEIEEAGNDIDYDADVVFRNKNDEGEE